jgi:hypothetical protein
MEARAALPVVDDESISEQPAEALVDRGDAEGHGAGSSSS